MSSPMGLIKRRASRLWSVLLVALAAGALVFAACGESATATPEPDPAPTASPAPTKTPVPTNTPAPTVMAEPTPEPTSEPEPTPEPQMAGPGFISPTDIDGTTTVGELVNSLSEPEVGCFADTFGETLLETFKDQPLTAFASGFGAFPLDCLNDQNKIGATVTFMSLGAGGFSDDTINCLVDTYGQHGLPDPQGDQIAAMRSQLNAQLCMTDEEAMALQASAPSDDALPPPSVLRCIAEQTDLENFIKVLEAFAMADPTVPATPDPELQMVMGEVMVAQEACGIQTVTPAP